MELKFLFSIFVLLNLKTCVSGSSVGVNDCMYYVNHYPEEAKGFADEDATQKNLEVAIRSIIKAYWKWKEYDYSNRAEDESDITTQLKQCYEIRKDPEFISQYQQIQQIKVSGCMYYVNHYPEEANGFADEDATQKNLELAIHSVIKAFWKWKEYDYSNRAQDESNITTQLKQCYGIRKDPEFIRQYQVFKIKKYPHQVYSSSWFICVQWITVVFGLIGNIALIAIFLKKKDLRLRFNSLMLTLAVFDVIFLCTQITESMAYYFEEWAFYYKMEVFSNAAFSLSTFTAVAISIERYCMLCRNIDTEKVHLWAILFTIMMIATLWMVGLDEWTRYIVSAVLYIIPAIVIAVLNVAIFRQLKRFLRTDQFLSATNEIKKVLFQIGLTNLIAIIFVGSQVAYAIWTVLVIFLYSDENREKFYKNPFEWETLYKFLACIGPITIICRLLNCSLDFYAYMLVRHRNQNAKTRRQQGREMASLYTTQKTVETNLETA